MVSTAMDISIIIPVFREKAGIERFLNSLFALKTSPGTEIIVVDGEPAQTTITHLKSRPLSRFSQGENSPALRLISSFRGRGPQMNQGAKAAKGKLFFFLHADTRVDQKGMDLLTRAWQSRTSSFFCGAFDLAIDAPGPWFRMIEKTASFRSRLTRIPYGDQGIFISRTLFEAVGGFPDQPLMEDVGLMARVKSSKTRPLFISRPVFTSARRWQEQGVVFTTLRNWILILLYICGVHPERLNRFY